MRIVKNFIEIEAKSDEDLGVMEDKVTPKPSEASATALQTFENASECVMILSIPAFSVTL
jgi:hypothetical protein